VHLRVDDHPSFLCRMEFSVPRYCGSNIRWPRVSL
jgi:hypothetical protein